MSRINENATSFTTYYNKITLENIFIDLNC